MKTDTLSKLQRFLCSVLFLNIALSTSALACPAIEGIPDFNCDGDLQIVVMGDSLVSGFGDTKNKNKGGYVLRTQRKLKQAAVQNLGILGLRTDGLLTRLKNAFDQGKLVSTKTALLSADIVVLDVGRNDRWIFGEPVDTYKNIAKAAAKIRTEVKEITGIEPMVVTAVMMLPNRGSQGPWVKALNAIILKNSTAIKPADLRFDLVSKRLLGDDQVHPTSAGYDALAKRFQSYLLTTLAKRMRALRPDTDGDGIPDIIESQKFLTDPALSDTDGDGKSDGEEILTLQTNPLVADNPIVTDQTEIPF